jgi:hypothetical protein
MRQPLVQRHILGIHGTGVAVSCEDCHSSFASHVILPFIGILVPVQFAQSSGMDDDMRRRDRIRGLENLRIDDAYFSCLCPTRRLRCRQICLKRQYGRI